MRRVLPLFLTVVCLSVPVFAQTSPDGAAVFQKYFGDMKVANFAVAGDTTQGLLWGLQNGEGQGHKPKVVMLMIGTNSAGSSSGEEIAEGRHRNAS